MSADILSGLLAANIAASAAILIVILIRGHARKLMGARLAYWLWLIPVLAGLATLLPAREAGTVPAPAAPIQPIAQATVELATAWAAPAPAAASIHSTFDPASMLAIVWAIGAAGFIVLMLLQQRRTLRALKLARDNRTPSNFGPAVVGVFKPFLVVPADFEQRFSSAEQNLVLAHEDVHLAAGHTRINAGLLVLTALNWFNPLVHWAAKLSRDDQELACDATVLERFPRERGSYAEALLKTQISSRPLPLGCTWPSRSSRFFKERMTMLANRTPSRARRMAGAGFVAAALLGAGLAAWAQKPPAPPVLTAPQALAGPGIVSVDKDGHVMWNGKPADTKEALTAAAKAQVASGARHIRILADLNTQYLNVGRVVQEAQKADIDDVTFMPSGTVLATPRPPGPGSNVPPPPPVSKPGSKPAASQPPSGFPDPKRIFVDFTNEVYLDRKVVDMATLEQAFKAAAALKIPPEVHIEPHRLSSYGKVEQVIAAANRAGLTKLGVLGGT